MAIQNSWKIRRYANVVALNPFELILEKLAHIKHLVDPSNCTQYKLNANTWDKEKMFRGQYCKCVLYVVKIIQFHNTTTIHMYVLANCSFFQVFGLNKLQMYTKIAESRFSVYK